MKNIIIIIVVALASLGPASTLAQPWYLSATTAINPHTGQPFGIVAFHQGSDTVWFPVKDGSGFFIKWDYLPDTRDFYVSTPPIRLGGAMFIEPNPEAPGKDLNDQYYMGYLVPIMREINLLRTHIWRLRESHQLPWPPN